MDKDLDIDDPENEEFMEEASDEWEKADRIDLEREQKGRDSEIVRDLNK